LIKVGEIKIIKLGLTQKIIKLDLLVIISFLYNLI